VWIVGGLFKGTTIDELVQAHGSRIRAVIAIGEDRDEPRRVMQLWAPDVPFVEVTGSDVMTEAVTAAASFAEDGDTVLLAPAAASMDQFVDYADRGRQFALAVKAHLGLDDE
jgi:UDP-N-acetylmuramoylalanine--D-glutamate ligase